MLLLFRRLRLRVLKREILIPSSSRVLLRFPFLLVVHLLRSHVLLFLPLTAVGYPILRGILDLPSWFLLPDSPSRFQDMRTMVVLSLLARVVRDVWSSSRFRVCDSSDSRYMCGFGVVRRGMLTSSIWFQVCVSSGLLGMRCHPPHGYHFQSAVSSSRLPWCSYRWFRCEDFDFLFPTDDNDADNDFAPRLLITGYGIEFSTCVSKFARAVMK